VIRILVAMQREAEALGLPCEVVGIGAKRLPVTTADDILVNVGYCGAEEIKPGTIVEPDETADYGTGIGTVLPTHFDVFHAPCFTSNKFVTEACSLNPSVYDMELARIAELPHKELYALKIVSDNLDEADCEAFNDEEAWEQVRTLLKGENLI